MSEPKKPAGSAKCGPHSNHLTTSIQSILLSTIRPPFISATLAQITNKSNTLTYVIISFKMLFANSLYDSGIAQHLTTLQIYSQKLSDMITTNTYLTSSGFDTSRRCIKRIYAVPLGGTHTQDDSFHPSTSFAISSFRLFNTP